MNLEHIVFWIGLSHLLQPPLALFILRRLQFEQTLSNCSPVLAGLIRNMAVASVALPTMLGVLLACHAHDIVSTGLGRSMAGTVAAFWSWRLLRQFHARAIGRDHAGARGGLHGLLSVIFFVQGPGLALLVLWTALAEHRSG